VQTAHFNREVFREACAIAHWSVGDWIWAKTADGSSERGMFLNQSWTMTGPAVAVAGPVSRALGSVDPRDSASVRLLGSSVIFKDADRCYRAVWCIDHVVSLEAGYIADGRRMAAYMGTSLVHGSVSGEAFRQVSMLLHFRNDYIT